MTKLNSVIGVILGIFAIALGIWRIILYTPYVESVYARELVQVALGWILIVGGAIQILYIWGRHRKKKST